MFSPGLSRVVPPADTRGSFCRYSRVVLVGEPMLSAIAGCYGDGFHMRWRSGPVFCH